MARSELDLWYEMWERAGSQGLDTWYELPLVMRGEEGSGGATDAEGLGELVSLPPKRVAGWLKGSDRVEGWPPGPITKRGR